MHDVILYPIQLLDDARYFQNYDQVYCSCSFFNSFIVPSGVSEALLSQSGLKWVKVHQHYFGLYMLINLHNKFYCYAKRTPERKQTLLVQCIIELEVILMLMLPGYFSKQTSHHQQQSIKTCAHHLAYNLDNSWYRNRQRTSTNLEPRNLNT